MLSTEQLATPRYGVLYLPTLTMLYLWSIPDPGHLTIFSITLTNDGLYLLFAGIGFIGAQLTQQFLVVIFGRGGPEVNPKKTSTALKHMFAISMNIDPDEISEAKLTSLIGSIWEISSIGDRRNAIRGLLMYFVMWFSTQVLMLYSIALLAFYLWNGLADIVAILLLLGMATIYVQKYIARLFPSSHPPESADFLWTPEYRRWERALPISDSPTPRIERRGPN